MKKPGWKRTLPKAAEPYKFKPGQSGNPGGKIANPIPNALKKLTNQSLVKIIKAIVKGNLDEIKRIAKDPTSSGLEVAIAACFIKAIERGDYNTVEHMLQRIVGKIPDKLLVESTSKNLNANINANIDSEKVRAIIDRLEGEI